MTHCQCGSFTPSPFFQPTIALPQVGARPSNSMSGLHQRCPHVAIASLGPSTEPFSCTFLVPGADTSPRAEVLGIWEAPHLRSHLCHQDVQNVSTHPIDLDATLNLLLKRMQMSLNLQFQVLDRTILRINEGKELSQQETMMLSHFGSQSGYELLLFGV